MKTFNVGEQWNRDFPLDNPELATLEKAFYQGTANRSNNEKAYSFTVVKKEKNWTVSTSYFIGIGWMEERKTAIRISPKFNDDNFNVDYISMLDDVLRDSKNFHEIDGLLEIDFAKAPIEISAQDDDLSLFLVAEYTHVIQYITSKGLKKAYHDVESNLHSKLKGKLLLGKDLRTNKIHGNLTSNLCKFQEYGIDIPENRLLKKALEASMKILDYYDPTTVRKYKSAIREIYPFWGKVGNKHPSDKVSERKQNSFFKEYTIAIKLAKLILSKSALSQVRGNSTTTTHPYWIDMSKLFELYVLAKLRNRFGDDNIKYQKTFSRWRQRPDFLLKKTDNHRPYVIDAKYKRYDEQDENHYSINIEDIRQVCGYARIKGIHDELGIAYDNIIPCLIVYPSKTGPTFINDEKLWNRTPIENFVELYKTGIKLPLQPAASYTPT